MPRPVLARALRTGVSMPALAYAAFDDYARHCQRREFSHAFKQFRLKIEVVGRFLMEQRAASADG